MGGGSEADFMIHGIMKYHLFGQELWITTTTVGMTIITIVLLILAFAANRAMKRATEVPGTFQNILELGDPGAVGQTVCQLYRHDLSVHPVL